MPHYYWLKNAQATSCSYHFTFYPRAIVDNILLVDFWRETVLLVVM